MIHLQNVSKHYSGRYGSIPVLDGLDLEVHGGEFLAVTGPSGSGKTTLLNLIGGLDRPDSGAVLVGGTRLDELDQNGLTRWRAQTVGFVFQSHYLMPMLSAVDNVCLPLLLTRLSRRERRQRAEQALSRVHLEDRARTTSPASFRADSSSAWASRGLSWRAHPFCCAMSPPVDLIALQRIPSSSC